MMHSIDVVFFVNQIIIGIQNHEHFYPILPNVFKPSFFAPFPPFLRRSSDVSSDRLDQSRRGPGVWARRRTDPGGERDPDTTGANECPPTSFRAPMFIHFLYFFLEDLLKVMDMSPVYIF